MSTSIQLDSNALQPIISSGGGIYSKRKGRKDSVVVDDKIVEDDISVLEKDVVDERDVRKKQVCGFLVLGLWLISSPSQ
jgi:hypothetical protein